MSGRTSFPDLTMRIYASFANAEREVVQLGLSGTFTRHLGPIAATKRRIEDVPLFAIVEKRPDGRIAKRRPERRERNQLR